MDCRIPRRRYFERRVLSVPPASEIHREILIHRLDRRALVQLPHLIQRDILEWVSVGPIPSPEIFA